MFVAMNRFKIHKGQETAFEKIWRERDSHLAGLPGFKAFTLLRGPEGEDHTLFASHTIWESREDFEAWTKSEAFRLAHKGAGSHRDIYIGHPEFEGFEGVEGTFETAD
ncbi:MAG: antibiotic biosynthesis monooxygenase [Pseudomonadota bacterium]